MKQTVFTAYLCVFGSLALWAQTNFYYQPATGFCGDPMPFYDTQAGVFRIYYLQEFRPNPEVTYHPTTARTSVSKIINSLSAEADNDIP